MHGWSSLQWYFFSEETFYLIFHVENPKEVEQSFSPVNHHPLDGS